MMLVNEEIEYKTIILKEQFEQIIRDYPFEAPIKQVNYYYDGNDNVLRDRNIMIRIRVIGDTKVFCLKYFVNQKLMEIEKSISDFSEIDTDKEIVKLLDSLIIGRPLKSIGYLSTTRYNLQLEDGIMSLDYNVYNNTEDYEIEYEVKTNSKKTKKWFVSFLGQYNIEYHQAISKVKRFTQSII